MRFKELERIIKKDGWYLDSSHGAHMHYKHPEIRGLVTIPRQTGDLDPQTVKSVLRMIGLK